MWLESFRPWLLSFGVRWKRSSLVSSVNEVVMIPCRFVYRFASGGASDSLNQVYEVHTVPQIGDTLCFIGGEGGGSESVVKEVVHYINPTKLTHEIVVFYGDRK